VFLESRCCGTGDATLTEAECWLLLSAAIVGVDRPEMDPYDRSSVSSVSIRSRHWEEDADVLLEAAL
jgi:hypothetical protein